jgi:DNA invertase Pin-like site-specific DNA recombinase
VSKATATAWLYLRVSTKRQAEKGGEPEGYSLPVQRQLGTQKAEELNAVVTEEYVDRGETARKIDRPELQRLLRDLREKEPPTYLIVYKIDRWARDTVDGITLLQELRQRGVKLVSAGENIDDTPEGRLLLTIMLGIAEYDSTGKAGRIRDNMRRAAEQGVTMGKAAVGYLNHREYVNGQELKSIILDPERAPLVRWAFEAYATGQWTLQALTDELADRGLGPGVSDQRRGRPDGAFAAGFSAVFHDRRSGDGSCRGGRTGGDGLGAGGGERRGAARGDGGWRGVGFAGDFRARRVVPVFRGHPRG